MKKFSIILTSLMLTTFSIYCRAASSDTLKILCAPELKQLADNWADKYSSSSVAEVIVNLLDQNDVSLLNKGDVVFSSGEGLKKIPSAGTMKIIVGRDVVVPVLNAENPLSEVIAIKGISAEKLADAIINSEKASWGYLLGNSVETKTDLYFTDDRIVKTKIAMLTRTEASGISGTMEAENLLSLVSKEKFSIGFCRLADILDENGSIISGIRLMPIDRNNNGVLDYNENIYSDVTSFLRGVWIGKYPKELCSNIYSVSNALTEDKKTTTFLTWILGEGQQVLGASGMTALFPAERMSATEKLTASKIADTEISGQKSVFGVLLSALAIIITLFIITDYAYRLRRKKPTPAITIAPAGTQVSDIKYELPGGVYFDKSHTWAFMEQTGSVRVGIDDFILHVTGKLSRINMKKAGDRVKKGEELLSLVQNGKKLTLYSPVSGKIRERNSDLENDASIISSAPYGSGWVYRIEPENWQRENQLLFMAEKHKQFIFNEMAKIKEMIVSMINAGQSQYAMVLQDGGMLHEGVLSQLGPEVWEEFQQKIIDPSRQVWFYEII